MLTLSFGSFSLSLWERVGVRVLKYVSPEKYLRAKRLRR